MSKLDLISSHLDDADLDVIAFTETWLSPAVYDTEISALTSIYNTYRYDRTCRRGGCVLLGIKKSIPSFLVNTNSDIEIVWVACKIFSINILVGCCYRPPDSNSSFNDQLRISLEKACEVFPSNITYLFGDFNFPSVDWDRLSSSCNMSTEFINLTLDYNLSRTVSQPTRGSNILDLILTSHPETLVHIEHVDGFSDHSLLQVTLNIPSPVTDMSPKIIRNYNKGNYAVINTELDSFWEHEMLPSFQSRSVEENWLMFREKMSRLIDI